MTMLLTLLALVFPVAQAQTPKRSPALERASTIVSLQEKSPCLLAFAKVPGGFTNKTTSQLFCILDRFEAQKHVCALTGYDLRADRFVARLPNGQAAIQVDKSCYDDGLEQILNRAWAGKSVRETLSVQTELLFSADAKFTTAFNQGLAEDRALRPPANTTSPRGSGLEPDQDLFTPVTVFYATDRNLTPGDKISFGDLRNDTGELSFGRADVSIPAKHQRGQLEEPSIFKLQFLADPAKHVVVLNTQQNSASDFMTQVRGKVETSREKEAFVFVHGYNTSFEDGLRRTAQLAYDLNFDGAPILYSWPAGDAIWKYSMAEANVEWTFRHLQKLLLDVAEQSGAQKINLIAHSMGNRVLTNALVQLQAAGQKERFNQIVLAAPDIDTQVFEQIAGVVSQAGQRVTIYASENDEALSVSQKFHSYRRLGQGGLGIFAHQLTDTVDASKLKDSLLGHSYFGDNTSVLGDLHLLMSKGLAPKLRPALLPQQVKTKTYWVISK